VSGPAPETGLAQQTGPAPQTGLAMRQLPGVTQVQHNQGRLMWRPVPAGQLAAPAPARAGGGPTTHMEAWLIESVTSS
jgi:hypothetical protein